MLHKLKIVTTLLKLPQKYVNLLYFKTIKVFYRIFDINLILSIIMPKHQLSFFVFIIYAFAGFAQQDSLHMPLNIPLYLSGSFGELRSNHFHSGLDIKTKNEEGLRVYAVDDGYVYRIKIRHNGYGKALYIKHPSGLVSVYGHLKNFNKRIEKYIKQKQYKKQSFEIEVFPYEIELPVKKGEVIAYSGNTGGSSGPHLHFELRNSQEHPLNPMSYGIKIKDHQRPVIRSVYAYPLDSLSHINQFGKRTKLSLKRINDSLFVTDTILAYGRIGFGIDAYDRMDFVKNHNGLYKIETAVNGLIVYEQVMKEFSFANSHFINTILDYPYFLKYRRRIQKLWVEPYNLLEIYDQLVDDGSLSVEHKKDYLVEIVLSDFENNNVKIKIPVKGYQTKILEKVRVKKTPFFIQKDQNNSIKRSPWKVVFRPKTVYENFYLKLDATSKHIQIKNPLVPLRKTYLIKYPLSLIKSKLRPYAYIALKKTKKRDYYIYTIKKNDSLTAYTKSFGGFVIRYDSIAPYVKPLNFREKADLTDYHFLKFKTGDKKSGIKSYNGYIDGQWILLEYDYKKRTLTYNFSDKKLVGRKHQLKIIVEDQLGNTKKYQTYFYRRK